MSKDRFRNKEVVIDWADLDLFGHVNNVAFFRYTQAARVDFCEEIGLTSLNDGVRPGFIVASAHCDYYNKLRYPGQVHIQTSVEWHGNTSFKLCHEMFDNNKVRFASSYDIIVVYDYEKGSKTAISPELIKSLESYGSVKRTTGDQ